MGLVVRPQLRTMLSKDIRAEIADWEVFIAKSKDSDRKRRGEIRLSRLRAQLRMRGEDDGTR